MYPDFHMATHEGLGVALIHKAASSSIRRSLTADPHYGRKPTIPVIAFIRDPIERLSSGYKFLRGRYTPLPKDRTYQEHVDIVLSGDDNIHWIPQAKYLEGIDDLICYPFKDLALIWDRYGFPPLRWDHKSEGVNPDTTYRLEDLKAYYRDDYEWL